MSVKMDWEGTDELLGFKEQLEAIHSVRSKGANKEKEEFVLGQHYPPGVIGMKNLVECWEHNLGYREKYDKLLLKETKTHNENVSLQSKVDHLTSEVISLVKKVQDREYKGYTCKDIKKFLEKVEKKEAECNDLMVSKRKAILEKVKALEEVDKLKREIEQSHEILKEANSDILGDIKKGLTKEQLKEQIKELEHQNYCLRQNAKGYGAEEVDEYREEIKELKEEIQELKDKSVPLERLEEEEEKVEEIQKGWEELRGQFGDLKEENEELKDEAVQNKKLFDITFGQFMKLKKDKEELKEECENVSIKWSQNLIREDEAISHINDLEKELKELKKESEEMYDILGTFTTNNPRGDYPITQVKKLKEEHERSCKIFKEHQEMMSKEKFENEEKIDKLEKDIVRIKQAITCDDPNDWSIDDVVEWLEHEDTPHEWSVVQEQTQEEIKKLLGKTDAPPEEIIEEIKSLISDAHRWEGRMNKLSEVIEKSLPKMDGWVTDEVYGELKKEFDKQSQTIQLAKQQRDNIVDYLVNVDLIRVDKNDLYDLLDISDDEVKEAEQRTIEKAQVLVDRGLKL
tara:strand:- start:1179 stop:2894 length:1716 start_codon:yes stop_codon:yes gene_type:complete